MTLARFLYSLTDAERDFIANLDYQDDFEKHRKGLDLVIKRHGEVDFESQLWHPYEVIELGKNSLQKGHEREFVACAGIVLFNISIGADNRNDWEISMSELRSFWNELDSQHRTMLAPLVAQVAKTRE